MKSPPDPGILTFLFSDLENSTPLWEQFPAAMRQAAAQHDELLQNAIENHGGQVVKTTGDGFHAVFDRPADGIAAALEAQQAMHAEAWPAATGPLKVRIGLHSGESQARAGDFYGLEVNLAARVMGLGHGGQVLVTRATAELVKKHLPADCTLSDLGKQRLKGISAPEQIFQLCHPDLPSNFPALQSLSAFKHNLPRQFSSFIGREKEIARVESLLKNTPLLTLVGPGGTGKTRLMLQAAEEAIENYPNGVWLVELAELTDPEQIPERVASALNVQEQPDRKMLDTLTEYLRRKDLLLLVDNVEHLVSPAAAFSEHLLARCPGLTIMTTGREALFISGERTLQIPSLALPEKEQTLEEVAGSESVQLFLARARSARPDFRLTEQNADALREVVRRLDGIPLALELAAARLRMLTIEQIHERLDDRFRLLTGGSRTALPRQQTLQALIDWSWNLLDESEKVLLRRLSVFSGGWTIESAQSITGFEPLDEFAVFDMLEQLIHKSLVVVEYPSGGQARYRLLESIRQYAQEKLFDSGEGPILRDRHADFFAAFALEAEHHMRRSTMLAWVERIVQELDNFRTVLAWTLEERPDLALRLSAALLSEWPNWIHVSEAFAWLDSATRATRGSPDQPVSQAKARDFIKALIGMALMQAMLGRVPAALQTHDEAISLAEAHGELRLHAQAVAQKTSTMTQHWLAITPAWIQSVEDELALCREHRFEWEQASIHFVLFGYLVRQGAFEAATPHFEKLQALTHKNRNPRSLAMLYLVQARAAYFRNELDATERLYRQAAEAFEAINDQRLALLCKSDLSHVLRRSGNLEAALPIYRESILEWQEKGSPIAVAHQLECFAFMAISAAAYERAARLLGAARETRAGLNAASTNPVEMAELEQAHATLEESLGETGLDSLMGEGRQMDLDDAVLLALQRDY